MVTLTVNDDHTAMTITVSGVVDVPHIKALYRDLQKEIARCERGFKVLTDLSRLKRMSGKAPQAIENVMQLCNQYGVSKIVRVIPDSKKDIGFSILSLFNYSSPLVIVTCQSTEEALKHMQ